ncbi:GNAT family N-acetyltransferase [Sinomicrobium kalidii]|uniref:GNAT family N-acetyltransferase n=1 Tax=Sinomicrobium kalidii TaxID=2900738 RepID=UPI001E2EBA75|nr:GNAT family N-acetyltransferase [Sinomicrobium kalidii]UGU15998.1 GNAT family N-acetyltransferase [Sinomicrobium kalidii]
MEFAEKKALTQRQKQEILDLWNREYPKDLSLADVKAFEDYLDSLADKRHLLLLDENGSVKGWLIDFVRDEERCFAMLLNPDQQGKGLGSRLLTLAKERNSELNGWVVDNSEELKENGEKYRSPIGFYEKNGFSVLPGVSSKKNNINGIRVHWSTTKNHNEKL